MVSGFAGKSPADPVAADPMENPFDIWIEGRLARFSSNVGDGNFAIVHAGADYLFTPGLLAGLGIQVDWASQDGANGAEISGTGYMVGPYVTARLTDVAYLDARAAWGQSFNDISPLGTFEDSFDTERWLLTAALVGQYDLGAWAVRPELRVSWFKDVSEAYADSLGITIPSVDVETGTLEFGPTFSTDYALANGLLFSPYLSFEGIWTFLQENTATVVSNQPGLEDEGLRAKAEIGAAIRAANGLSMGGSVYYDGIGSSSNFEAWGGKLMVNKAF